MAREIFILIYSMLLSIIIFIVVSSLIWLHDYILKTSKESTLSEANQVRNEIFFLSESYNSKASEQEWFLGKGTNVTNKKLIDARNKYKERGYVMSKEKWNEFISNEHVRVFLAGRDIDDPEKFSLYINKIIINKNDVKSKLKSDSLRIVFSALKRKAEQTESKIVGRYDKIITFTYISILVLAIVFPLRYLLYSIQWSAKVLNQDN